MTIGLRALLLVVAVILFIVAALSDTNWSDLVAWGLACIAAALLVGELGLDRAFSAGRRR